MYTQCPHCQTIFGVSEAHLSAAFGRVRCGHCRGQFNAKRHLLESIPEQKPAPVASRATPVAKMQTDARPATETLIDVSPPDLPEVIPADEIEHIDLSCPTEEPPPVVRKVAKNTSPLSPAPDSKPSAAVNKPKNEELEAIFAALDHRLEELSEDTPQTVLKPYEEFNTGDTRPNRFQDAFGDPDSQTEADIQTSIEHIFAAAEAELIKTDTVETDHASHHELPSAGFLPDVDVDAEVELMGTAEVDQPDKDFDIVDSQLEDIFTTEFDTDIENFDIDMIPTEEISFPNDDGGSASKTDSQQARPPVFEQEELPFLLHDTLSIEQAPPRSWAKSIALAGIIIVLFAAIGFQLALFRNIELANKVPELQPYLLKFCQYLPCQFTGQRDVKRIHLTSRDVRTHPDDKNTIIISAIFVNNARFDQPYPDILITLSDLTTTVLAQRRFTPQDYLASNNPFLLMKAGKPVQITLEVLDPGNDAVNFQFDFL